MARKRSGTGDQLGLEGSGVDLLKEAEAARISASIRHVEPRRIGPAAAQPRLEFEPGRLSELAESIRHQGVLQPLLVRELEDGTLQLLAGERRLRAATMVGLERVPVRVLSVSDVAAVAITLTENLAREDLTAWEEALGLAQLRDALAANGEPRNRDDLARLVGRSGGSVSESLQIADRLVPILETAAVDGQTLTRLPKIALHGAAQGKSVAERVELLRLAAAKAERREAAGKAVAAAKSKRGRPPKPWTVSDRLRDRGTLSFNLRRRPEELTPDEARRALDRLAPVFDALRDRAGSADGADA